MTTWSEVQATLGRPLTSDEITQVELWIEDTRTIIAARLGDLTLLDQTVLGMVVREAVANRIKRPDSLTQVSISVDDAQESRTYQTGSGQIDILAEWWAMLAPAVSVGAFTVRPFYASAV